MILGHGHDLLQERPFKQMRPHMLELDRGHTVDSPPYFTPPIAEGEIVREAGFFGENDRVKEGVLGLSLPRIKDQFGIGLGHSLGYGPGNQEKSRPDARYL